MQNIQTDESVKLTDLLPEAFSDCREQHVASDIWMQPEVEIRPGDRLLLRAASGNGKSSLCSFIYGLRRDYSGEILINGKNVKTLSANEPAAIRQSIIAFLPQDMKLFGELTAMENIQLKNRLTASQSSAAQGRAKGFKSNDEIAEMLDAVGLTGFETRRCDHLSIGQQQRVAVVRTLCQPFHYLLLDEPVSHLDEASNRAVARLVDREITARGAALIVTSVGNDLDMPGLRILNL